LKNKRAVGLILVVLLLVQTIHESEASWFSKTFNKVKGVAKGAVKEGGKFVKTVERVGGKAVDTVKNAAKKVKDTLG
jgi:hypothetical protein